MPQVYCCRNTDTNEICCVSLEESHIVNEQMNYKRKQANKNILINKGITNSDILNNEHVVNVLVHSYENYFDLYNAEINNVNNFTIETADFNH